MSFQPGMSTDRELARVYYSDALEQAARDRTQQQRRSTHPGEAARRILLAASVVGLVAVMVWLVAAAL